MRFLTGTPISIQAYLGNPGLTGVWSKDTAGPISRTVEDSAITLGAIAGYDPKDPYTLDIPVPDYRSALDGDIKGVRVGVISEHINSPLVEPQVRDAVVKATNVLGELGAVVEEVSLPLVTHSAAFFTPIALAETALIHSRWTRERLQDYGHNNRIGLLTGNLIPAQAYYKAQKLRVLLRRQLLQALASYDVLALPTAGRAAQRISDDAVITSKRMAERIPFVFTRIFNQAGTPLHLCTLRVYLPGPAHRPSAGRKTLRREGALEGGPRLRAKYILAHYEATFRIKKTGPYWEVLGMRIRFPFPDIK